MNHVAFLIPGIDCLAGAEWQVIRLAKGLARRGWRVHLIALSGHGGDSARDLHRAGVSFLSLDMRKGIFDPRGWMRLRSWIRGAKPDVLHAHLPHATWIARAIRIAQPVRVVVDTIHTSAVGPLRRRAAYRFTGWLSDRTTAVSADVRGAYLAAGAVKPDRIEVLPNGIDVNEWQPDDCERAHVRQELGLTEEFLWCAAGRLEPVKHYSALLQAFAALPSSAELVILGSGSQEASLRKLAGDPIFGNRVHFLGFQQDVRRWMRAADGFVLSSLWEGLPVSLLEASACGLPGVATGVSGVRAVMDDGQTGFIAETASVDSLARAMRRLMRMSPDSRRSMGLDARQRVIDGFSMETVLDRWEGLYCELLRKNPVPLRRASRIARTPITRGSGAYANGGARAARP